MTTGSPHAFRPIADLLTEVSGMAFREARLADVATASRALMQRQGIRSIPELRAALVRDPSLLDKLAAALVVPETYFFRDLASFAFLRNVALPALLDVRPKKHQLRIWSAGCSTGEEPYSVAMLLDEMGLLERANVLGTDLSVPALEKARAGRYRPWSFRGESGARARPWVEQQGDELVVIPRIRAAVRFAPLNLAADDYPSAERGTADVDLILCRNVLIYLEPEAVAGVARRLYASLAHDGWLLTAAADPLLVPLVPLRPVLGAGIAYCKSEVAGAATTTTSASFTTSASLDTRERAAPRPESATPSPPTFPRLSPPSRAKEHKFSSATAPSPPPPRPPSQPSRPAAAPPSPARATELVDELRAVFDAGRYDEVISRVGEEAQNDALASLVVRALANAGDLSGAEARVRREIKAHPLSVELHYLRALLLLALRKPDEAVEETRRLLYLSPDLAVGHLLQGRLLLLLSDEDGARRAFRNASACLAPLPDDAILELGEGQTVGQTREAAQQALRTLTAPPGS